MGDSTAVLVKPVAILPF
uniref:Uncharacterized protein n=1 Tax=Anguilla anguilla TaxID=7936 RepID=A0A0E9ST22_ANGAN